MGSCVEVLHLLEWENFQITSTARTRPTEASFSFHFIWAHKPFLPPARQSRIPSRTSTNPTLHNRFWISRSACRLAYLIQLSKYVIWISTLVDVFQLRPRRLVLVPARDSGPKTASLWLLSNACIRKCLISKHSGTAITLKSKEQQREISRKKFLLQSLSNKSITCPITSNNHSFQSLQCKNITSLPPNGLHQQWYNLDQRTISRMKICTNSWLVNTNETLY